MVFVLLEHLSGFCAHRNSSQSLKATDSYTALTLCFRRALHMQYNTNGRDSTILFSSDTEALSLWLHT